MSYEPEFMKKHEEYNREKLSINNIEDWIRFNNKWYDEKDWPKKTSIQEKEESKKNRKPLKLGERIWFYTFFLYDITPEARYEMQITSNEIGLPLALPNGIHKPTNPNDTDGWTQECPFDGIATLEIGEEKCPICGRKLIYVWAGD